MLDSVSEGCYEAPRAAALSGVPLSTVYHWARTGVVTPTVSHVRERLWSYADLLALRVVSWLRHPKASDGVVVGASSMASVREALEFAAAGGVDFWEAGGDNAALSGLRVDRTGRVWVVMPSGELLDAAGDSTLELEGPYLDLLAPFEQEHARGPHLLVPRPDLRIVPAKVAGEPHAVGSRITTRNLAALARRGFGSVAIADMYGLALSAVEQAVELESQLAPATVAA